MDDLQFLIIILHRSFQHSGFQQQFQIRNISIQEVNVLHHLSFIQKVINWHQ